MDYGFDAVISPRFGEIFRNNCTKNGLVPIRLEPDEVERLMTAIEADPELEITIDIERRSVSAPRIGLEASFPIDDATQNRFLHGLDDIGLTLQHAREIDAYETTRPSWLPIVR
jgi:3-isopropylmalate/(R)-2-methylmalate dehydratase small subunit